MPRLIIDDRTIEVPPGTKVIEAAERLGIMIPRFCYHKGLGSVGACRMCAVKFLQGPFKGVQMSCMIDAQDGMEVSTTDDEVVDFRKHVIEWLMLNHPHDCPVCDEGGHCLLQDMTVSGGHSIRRFLGNKRTYRDQYLGALIQHEMNRCIQCYRCVRFYQDFCGYRDLGVMQIAHKVYFGRFSDGPLESPFCGNLADLCPTGVYTDKPARFKARRWDLERGPSLCIHCSLGCNTIAGARYREILRQEARLNESVNGYFICDRGRFGFAYASHLERPRSPRVGAQDVSWDEALQSATERLTQHKPESIAVLGSVRNSLETMGMLNHLAKTMSFKSVDYFLTDFQKKNVQQAVSNMDRRLTVSMWEIEAADFIIAVGVDPISEAPMLALAMRQAQRNAARIVVIDPRPVFLPFDFDHLPVPLKHIDTCLGSLVKSALNEQNVANLGEAAISFYRRVPSEFFFDSAIQEKLSKLIPHLEKSQRPIVICGTDVVSEMTVSLAADLTMLLQENRDRAGLFYVLPGANSFGAAIFDSNAGRSFLNTLQAIEDGSIKVLIVVESDPFWHFPDAERLRKAVEKLEFILVLDYLPSMIAKKAHTFLPTRTLFETRSSFINQEGRLQFAEQIHLPGAPIWQVSNKSHPPRLYGTGIPGGDPRVAWKVLADLSQGLLHSGEKEAVESPWQIIAGEFTIFANMADLNLSLQEMQILPEESSGPSFKSEVVSGLENPSNDQLEIILVDWTFGTEELASYSEIIQQVEDVPCACMHPGDGKRLGLLECQRILLKLDRGEVKIDLSFSERMAPGTLVLPKHRQLNWQKMTRFPTCISPKDIEKEGFRQRDAAKDYHSHYEHNW